MPRVESLLEDDASFPRKLDRVRIPPIKCQGIKSKLVRFIFKNIKWDGNGRWFEPFMGSGVVGFNADPRTAFFSDVNPHLINFYTAIQRGEITPDVVTSFLEKHGDALEQTGTSRESYYYEMRDVFNETEDPLHFLFLNRSCFNGLMRFNSGGMFNAAFGKNPARFTRSYISKIAGQVAWARHVILGNNFRFTCCDWKEAVSHARRGDFVYIDPPYLGRTTTYYEGWNEDDAAGLLEWSRTAECAFAISSWSKNAYRENPELKKYVDHCTIALASHFYFIGSTEENRHEMQEALILKKKVEKT